MKRMLGILAILAAGCCLPADREVLRPLSKEGKIYSYLDILARARAQASIALEAFYVDDWMDLEQSAKVLEQTAHFLPRTSEQPAQVKKNLVQESEQLRQEAVRLGEAARTKNIMTANESLQRIHLAIRSLRPPE